MKYYCETKASKTSYISKITIYLLGEFTYKVYRMNRKKICFYMNIVLLKDFASSDQSIANIYDSIYYNKLLII